MMRLLSSLPVFPERSMRLAALAAFAVSCCVPSLTPAQSCLDTTGPLAAITQAHDYVQKRSSSYDRTGANADARAVAPGETLTVLDDAGPGAITHIWFTIATDESLH